MENKFLKGNKKKLLLPLALVVLVIATIAIVLAGNKKKINKAAAPVDRTKIPVAVTVAKALVKPLDVDVQYPAVTQPYEEAMLYAQTGGLIVQLNILLGQQVIKGQVLGRLDTQILQNNLKAAEINLRSASINKAKLLEDYNRAKDLYENKAGLEVEVLTAKNNYENAINTEENARVQIQLTKQQIANSNIIAPVNGIISTHTVKQGEYVNPSTPIATISNITAVKARVFVSQELIYKLKQGQEATVSLVAVGSETYTGQVIFISPVADANHNYQVDLLVKNNAGTNLKGGTDVQVAFNTLSKTNALLIPKTALNFDTEQVYVYVAKNGHAVKKEVTTGVIKNDWVEVISGLSPGESVITAGQINLADGSKISINK